jgi:hypothetical protein
MRILTMTPQRRLGRFAIIALGALAATGCGGGPKLVPVTGRVQYADGRPVSAASICFTPETGDNQSILATGLLALDGSFALRTYPHGDGAMVGPYKVTVSLGRAPKDLAKYTRLKDTPLRIEIPPEGLTDLVVTLR